MSLSIRAAAIAAASLLVFASDARAHITLEQQQAAANSTYKAVLRVPHGCEGSPTVRLRVQVPDGMVNVKPQPKAGWELTTVRGPLPAPVAGDHGVRITEGVREIVWSGGRLLDEHYDEFAFRGQLPNRPGEIVHVPVVQECEKGVERWIEIPAAGKGADTLRFPAPSLRLTPRP
ncbi:MAG: YcnI family protein [Proteobacteria bacterium]|nr:YcnI family protein [Pseudomonadota bacterium]